MVLMLGIRKKWDAEKKQEGGGMTRLKEWR
jgi:hypothetical protein